MLHVCSYAMRAQQLVAGSGTKRESASMELSSCSDESWLRSAVTSRCRRAIVASASLIAIFWSRRRTDPAAERRCAAADQGAGSMVAF
jgi:hypothetical protein